MSIETEWLASKGEDEDDDPDQGKRMFGVVTGTVMPFIPDPQGLGRIRVQIAEIDSLDPVAWARVAAPSAGLFHGNYFIPNPGDSVLVAFEHGDVGSPYIIGSLWHSIARPPVPLAELQIRTLRTLVGNQIVMTEIPPAIVIQTPAPPGVTPAPPSPAGPMSTVTVTTGLVDTAASLITLRSGASNVLVSPAGITMQAGSSFVQIGPEGITMTSAGNIISIGPLGITIQGSLVNINPI
jgi:hypothetical protein